MTQILVHHPAGAAEVPPEVHLNPGRANWGGATVGILDNTKHRAGDLMQIVAERMADRFGDIRIVRTSKENAAVPATESDYAWLANECDVVLTGSGD
jgi:hypothetical protein